MFQHFYDAMVRFLPEDARIMCCQFRGDPEDDIVGKWRARVMRHADSADEYANVYLCVSAMRKNSRGEFRRRKENFAGGLLLMIDDIGNGKGSKFPMSILDPLPPTALIETSPGNFQAVYMFDSLVEDIELFDALIKAFIREKFLSADTGMAGVNRVFRPPVGVNGKKKHGGWLVRMTDWHPERRYSVAQIAAAFDLRLTKQHHPPRDQGIISAAKAERLRAFVDVRAALRAAGMIKKEEPDYSGWIHISCPWTHNHTGGVDNGAAIRLPDIENEWHGAMRCHHGSCDRKGWRQLTDWLVSEQAEVLDLINRNAP